MNEDPRAGAERRGPIAETQWSTVLLTILTVVLVGLTVVLAILTDKFGNSADRYAGQAQEAQNSAEASQKANIRQVIELGEIPGKPGYSYWSVRVRVFNDGPMPLSAPMKIHLLGSTDPIRAQTSFKLVSGLWGDQENSVLAGSVTAKSLPVPGDGWGEYYLVVLRNLFSGEEASVSAVIGIKLQESRLLHQLRATVQSFHELGIMSWPVTPAGDKERPKRQQAIANRMHDLIEYSHVLGGATVVMKDQLGGAAGCDDWTTKSCYND